MLADHEVGGAVTRGHGAACPHNWVHDLHAKIARNNLFHQLEPSPAAAEAGQSTEDQEKYDSYELLKSGWRSGWRKNPAAAHVELQGEN